MKRDTLQEKFIDISRQVSPASIPGVSAGNSQRTLAYESEMIKTQIVTRNRS
jgi:hypothetical protein